MPYGIYACPRTYAKAGSCPLDFLLLPRDRGSSQEGPIQDQRPGQYAPRPPTTALTVLAMITKSIDNDQFST